VEETVTSTIDKLRAMLEPDGYDLVVAAQRADTVDLQVVAGSEACEDCLVPKEVFAQVVSQYLDPAGLHLGELTYPNE
jgi:hypothetical protein